MTIISKYYFLLKIFIKRLRYKNGRVIDLEIAMKALKRHADILGIPINEYIDQEIRRTKNPYWQEDLRDIKRLIS